MKEHRFYMFYMFDMFYMDIQKRFCNWFLYHSPVEIAYPAPAGIACPACGQVCFDAITTDK